jgi:uncharacterized protein YhaN
MSSQSATKFSADRSVIGFMYDKMTEQSNEITSLTTKVSDLEEQLAKYERIVSNMHLIDGARCIAISDLKKQLDEKKKDADEIAELKLALEKEKQITSALSILIEAKLDT